MRVCSEQAGGRAECLHRTPPTPPVSAPTSTPTRAVTRPPPLPHPHSPILPCHQQEAGLMRCTWPPAGLGKTSPSAFLQLLINRRKIPCRQKLSTEALCLERSFLLKLERSQFPGLSPTPRFPLEKGCGRPRKEEGRRLALHLPDPSSFPFLPPSHLQGLWLQWCYCLKTYNLHHHTFRQRGAWYFVGAKCLSL